MIVALAFALAQAIPATAPGEAPVDADPILVVGERLKGAGARITLNPFTGRMKCKVTTPSGDARIDAAACEIGLRCARQHRRDREQFGACMDAGRETFLDEYFAESPEGSPSP